MLAMRVRILVFVRGTRQLVQGAHACSDVGTCCPIAASYERTRISPCIKQKNLAVRRNCDTLLGSDDVAGRARMAKGKPHHRNVSRARDRGEREWPPVLFSG